MFKQQQQQQQPSLLFPRSWGKLEMKPHEPKKRRRGKQRAIKKQIKKGEKTIKR
jgi:hypothetical protein